MQSAQPSALYRAVVAVSLFFSLAQSAAGQILTDLEMKGRFAELEKAAEQKLAKQGKPSTSVLSPLCFAYSRVKRYQKLFDCLDRLEQQIRAGDWVAETDASMISNSDATPMPAMLRAEALIELGGYPRAAEQAKLALSKVQDRLPYGIWAPKRYRLSLLGTLGLAYALGGDRKGAAEQIKQLEDFSIGFIGSAGMTPLRANAIARIYMALGDFARAFEQVREDDAWMSAVYFLNNASWGLSGDDRAENFVLLPKMLIRGKCLSELGRLAEAKQSLDAILRNARVVDQGELHWLALFERGRIAEREQNFSEAVSYYLRAIKVIEEQRSSINTEANKIGFVGDKQAVYGRVIALLVEQGKESEAFEYVERSKSRALVDMLASKKEFSARTDPEKARLILAQLDAADLASRTEDVLAKPGEHSALRTLQTVRQEMQRAAPELSTLVTVTSVPAEELKRLVRQDEALLEYYYQGSDLYAFVVTRDRLQAKRLAGGDIVAQVLRFRRALERADSEQWQTQARALYELLWQPLESMLSARSVTVVAHGALHYLPFAALQKPDGSFLVDHYGLRFLPSASVLKFLRPALPGRRAQLLALGNPDLGDPKLDLHFAEGEAKTVAAIFPESRVLLRTDATESNFKKAGSVFPRIHFATHGKFQADDPLSSGLYLARDAENDGVLTVGELYSMNLDADLVTLSACETGLGKVANGDDVVGLTRGFLYAGSRSIVASLWNVDDRATAQLMKAFYENLAGMNKEEALRQAQIRTRQDFPPPFFWAAFQLTGQAE